MKQRNLFFISYSILSLTDILLYMLYFLLIMSTFNSEFNVFTTFAIIDSHIVHWMKRGSQLKYLR